MVEFCEIMEKALVLISFWPFLSRFLNDQMIELCVFSFAWSKRALVDFL